MSIVDNYQQYIYTDVYFAVLAAMLFLEIIYPLRNSKHSLLIRWTSNISLGLFGTFLQKFLMPVVAVTFAIYVKQQGWGLFNLVAVPGWIAIILSLLVLDYSRYVIHWLFHYIPLFWSFHKIHHSDPDYDISTSYRFHPLEILLGTVNSLLIILLLGMPVISVIIAELMVVFVNFFSHANIRLPGMPERIIRLIIVTPDMHRIHHAAERIHTDSNYSIVFPWWDYLGRTYTPVGSVDQKEMTVGLDDCQGKKHLNFFWLLAMPFIPARRKSPLK